MSHQTIHPWLAQSPLKEIKQQLAADIASHPLPAKTEENWRRSSPEEFDPLRWQTTETAVEHAIPPSLVEALGEEVHLIEVGPGRVKVHGLPLQDGVELFSEIDAFQDEEAIYRRWLDADGVDFGGARYHRFQRALTQNFSLIRIGKGVEVTHPIYIWHAHQGPLVATTLVDIGDDAKVMIGEDWACPMEGSQKLVHVHTGRGAQLRHAVFAEGEAEGNHLGHIDIDLGDNGSYSGALFLSGGRRSRVFHTTRVGQGGHSLLKGVVVGQKRQHFDIEPRQIHQGRNGQSDMFFKTVLAERSRAVFQGDIHVLKEAVGCDARQKNKNLLLSPKARVDTIPQLHVLPEDVSCHHGAATSSLDPEQLYYLMARGFSHASATEMIIRGFLAEILDAIEENPLQLSFLERLHNVAQDLTETVEGKA